MIHPEVCRALTTQHVADMRDRARRSHLAARARRSRRHHPDPRRHGPIRALTDAVSRSRPAARHRRPNRTPRERQLS